MSPPTFCKTEHSSVRQLSYTTDNKRDSIHYFSWLFGILLACIALLPALMVPSHNILKEPFYEYEIHVYFMIPWLVIIAGLYILRFEYWANIPYARNWSSYFILCSTGSIFYIALFLFYFYVWVHYLELFAPLPLGPFLSGNLTIFWLAFILFFRYQHTLDIYSYDNIFSMSVNFYSFILIFDIVFFWISECLGLLKKTHKSWRGTLISG